MGSGCVISSRGQLTALPPNPSPSSPSLSLEGRYRNIAAHLGLNSLIASVFLSCGRGHGCGGEDWDRVPCVQYSSWRVEGTCVSYNKGQGVFVFQDRSLCIFYLFLKCCIYVCVRGRVAWVEVRGRLVGVVLLLSRSLGLAW